MGEELKISGHKVEISLIPIKYFSLMRSTLRKISLIILRISPM